MTTIVVFWEFMEVYRPKLVVKDTTHFPYSNMSIPRRWCWCPSNIPAPNHMTKEGNDLVALTFLALIEALTLFAVWCKYV